VDACNSGETKLTVSQLSEKAPTGDTGPAGATGSLGRTIVFSEQPLSSSLSATGSVACPVGKTTLSGGCYTDSPFYLVYQSYPFDGSPNEWRCELTRIESYNSQYSNSKLITYAICVDQ
jgi:hypothetical protein